MHPNPELRVFVIWQPVILTDYGTPSATITASVPDRRAVHFWDRDLSLSALYGNSSRLASIAEVSHIDMDMGDVLWDAALVYPPGSRWGSRAKIAVAPVVHHSSKLKEAIAQ